MDGPIVLVPILGILAPMTMIILVIYFIARTRQRQAQFRAEVQTKMIEKFGSAPEFTEFLASPAGKQFIGELHSAPSHSAHDRIFSGVKWSLILAFLGLAFFVGYFSGADHEMIIPGSILLGLGIALAISTVVSYRLSRAWGLIKPAGEAGTTVTT